MATALPISRLKNPVFQGRINWLQRWNRKRRQFEDMDIRALMVLLHQRHTGNKN